jgi:hypothetical protein
MPELYSVETDKKGKRRLVYNLHEGQRDALLSEKRVVAMIAGTQGGKTSFGPLWLLGEIKKMGQGDYIVATPTYKLLKLKALPEFLKLFEHFHGLGHYIKSEDTFVFSKRGSKRMFGKRGDFNPDEETRVIFGHASNPESLESATAKGVWCDEAGQKQFRLDSYEALMRRLSIHQGRMLITTTPYNLGWLKSEIYDVWINAGKDHSYIDVIQFESTRNPSFPEDEIKRAKDSMAEWKYEMFYLGKFARPQGLIYGMFDDERDIVYDAPEHEPYKTAIYIGVDFGGVNTAILFYVKIEGELYLVREYKSGNKTAKEHVADIKPFIKNYGSIRAYGGAASEGQWRDEFKAGGLNIKRPDIGDVEVGIDRVIQWHRSGNLKIKHTCKGYLEEKRTYSRKTDDSGRVLEDIENKNSFHFMDAERYALSSIPMTKVDYSKIARANKQVKENF